jgi:endonuclease YncB( thermonuclease family)
MIRIDAPEARQTCGVAPRVWACGRAATDTLARIIADGVECSRTGIDRYRRTVAICRDARGGDVGAVMVSTGMAVAYRRYSARYVAAEDEARLAARGIWSGEFVRPDEFRRSGPNG